MYLIPYYVLIYRFQSCQVELKISEIGFASGEL